MPRLSSISSGLPRSRGLSTPADPPLDLTGITQRANVRVPKSLERGLGMVRVASLRRCPSRRRQALLAFAVGIVALLAGASVARAGEVSGSCTVPAGGYCNIGPVESYYYAEAFNSASFNVSVAVNIIAVGGAVLSQGGGNTCNSCLYQPVFTDDYGVRQSSTFQLYNPDTQHSRTFTFHGFY